MMILPSNDLLSSFLDQFNTDWCLLSFTEEVGFVDSVVDSLRVHFPLIVEFYGIHDFFDVINGVKILITESNNVEFNEESDSFLFFNNDINLIGMDELLHIYVYFTLPEKHKQLENNIYNIRSKDYFYNELFFTELIYNIYPDLHLILEINEVHNLAAELAEDYNSSYYGMLLINDSPDVFLRKYFCIQTEAEYLNIYEYGELIKEYKDISEKTIYVKDENDEYVSAHFCVID